MSFSFAVKMYVKNFTKYEIVHTFEQTASSLR